jgi:hypothetical protein
LRRNAAYRFDHSVDQIDSGSDRKMVVDTVDTDEGRPRGA